MSELSNHTKLMNTVICLSTKSYRYCQPVLYENHYELESIEFSFNKIDGGLIDTDIILKNPELNKMLIVECKSGALEKEQADRYKGLSKEDIVNANITTLNSDLDFQITYLTDSENKDKLIKSIIEHSADFPIILNDGKKLSLAHNSIKCKALYKLLTENGGISIPENPPLTYYPFGVDDSEAHLLNCIGPVLIKLLGQEFNVEEVLFSTHRIYEHISDKGIKTLKGRIGKILTNLSKSELNEFFDVPSSKQFSLKNVSPRKFQNRLNKYIAEVDQNPLTEKQLELSSF